MQTDVLEAMKIGANGTPTFVSGRASSTEWMANCGRGSPVPNVRYEAEGSGEVGLPGGPNGTGPGGLSYSERKLQRHLDGARSVLLRRAHHAETRVGGVAVGRREARWLNVLYVSKRNWSLHRLANRRSSCRFPGPGYWCGWRGHRPSASDNCGYTRRSPGTRHSWWYRRPRACSWRRAGSSHRSRPDRW